MLNITTIQAKDAYLVRNYDGSAMLYTPTQEHVKGAVSINKDEGMDDFQCNLACMANGYKDVYLAGGDEDSNFVDEDLDHFYKTLNRIDIKASSDWGGGKILYINSENAKTKAHLLRDLLAADKSLQKDYLTGFLLGYKRDNIEYFIIRHSIRQPFIPFINNNRLALWICKGCGEIINPQLKLMKEIEASIEIIKDLDTSSDKKTYHEFLSFIDEDSLDSRMEKDYYRYLEAFFENGEVPDDDRVRALLAELLTPLSSEVNYIQTIKMKDFIKRRHLHI